MNIIRRIFTFSLNLPIVKISTAIFLFLLTAFLNSYASEEFYTIQTGSFSLLESAEQHFDSLMNELDEDELGYFRIEKVGTFYSVRLGKFMNKSEAEKLLHIVIPQFYDALILKARILDERIVRIYEREDSLSSTVGKERVEEIREDTVSVDKEISEEVKQVSLSEPENDDKNNSTDVTQTHAGTGVHDSEIQNIDSGKEAADTSDTETVGEEQIEEIGKDTVSVDREKSEEIKQASLSEPENDDKNNSTDVTRTYAENGAQNLKMENVRTDKEGSDTPDNKKPEVYEYTLEIGDVLFISVWEEEDLKEEVIVRPDGKISFPFAGDIYALGLTFNQLKQELTKRLKEYIKFPIVSISFRKLGGKKVIVLGEVKSPGVYSVTGKQTVLEAIAQAKGFTLDAVKSSVIHIRGGLQAPQGTRLDLSSAIKETEANQNIALQSEDIVYVPRKFIADVNYVANQILGPIFKGVWTVHGFDSLIDND